MVQNNYFYEEALNLTKALVAIPSMNGTDGERQFALHVAEWLGKLPYFQAHSQQVIVQELKNDPLRRCNVFGLVMGEKSDAKDTVILHGHLDTVDIEEYGSLKEFAFDCDALPEKIKALTDDPEVLADIDSGEWMFGRGVFDMKCGDAVLLCLTKYFSEHADRFDGNILYMINPVEENQHYGVMDALDVLEGLKAERGLNFVMAINADLAPAEYPGDPHRYFHSGAVGKILPCFYIIGKPTHAGRAYEGFSATLAASEIVRQMELRADFADEYNGEITSPPLNLKCRDLKPSYNVTSTLSYFLYFNYFIESEPMKDIIARLRRVAENAMEFVNAHTDAQYRRYCARVGCRYQTNRCPTHVLEYSELYKQAKELYPDIDRQIREITEREIAKDTDRREISLAIVEMLCQKCGVNEPTAVLFFAPPYCPRNTMKESVPQEKAFLNGVRALLAEMEPIVQEKLKLMQFFPVLSDSSYLKIDDDQESIDRMVEDFPDYRGLYNVPLDKIKRMNIPAFNFGCYGKDGHRWTERVHKPYTFGKLPTILLAALEKYLVK